MRSHFILFLTIPILAMACMAEDKREVEAYLEAENTSRSHRAAFLEGYAAVTDYLNNPEDENMPTLESLGTIRQNQQERVASLEKISVRLPKLKLIHDKLLAAERRILNGVVAFQTGEKLNRKDRKTFSSHASLMQVAAGNAEPLFQEVEALLKALCTEMEMDCP